MSLNSFVNISGTRIARNIEVMRLVARNPVRYECFCHICLSSWTEMHTRLVNEGASYKCRNVACALGRVTPRPPVPPTEKPAPVIIPAAAPRVSDEYRRYQQHMRLSGHESSIVSFADFNRLDGETLRRVMAPVEQGERQRAAEQQGKEFERQFNEDFNRKYGIGGH